MTFALLVNSYSIWKPIVIPNFVFVDQCFTASMMEIVLFVCFRYDGCS